MAQTRRQRRRQSNQHRTGVLLGCIGALIAGLLVYQVFFRSSDTTSPTASSSAPVAAVDGGTTPPTTSPLEPTLPNVSFEDFTLRDPFEPVINTGGGGSSTTSTTTTTTNATGETTTTTTTPQQTNPGGAQDVELVDVTPLNGVLTARVRVGTTEYTVTAGQVFAVNYQLVSFDGETCANFTHADAPFRLCVGEQALK